MLTLLKTVFGSTGTNKLKQVVAQGAVIVDVRSPNEFDAGHAKGALNIPLDELKAKAVQLKNYQKPIVLCCASGMRSSQARLILLDEGITNMFDAGSWRNLK
ncbi:rhodanese-like domain-containing protein [Fibrella forsythiae]|uniref:Rhodanese-like domain-containing protein n=1 Tax=Fibrella forsythiae TaxID=2817061 RepID=A0ABS3JSJ4_9BACT|nr:rhodanese-like domain-containing protein [Fibrella forsythiae]MBO0952169.1 rhodanese-like domain-containing protein [Fibrella forsythiae]